MAYRRIGPCMVVKQTKSGRQVLDKEAMVLKFLNDAAPATQSAITQKMINHFGGNETDEILNKFRKRGVLIATYGSKPNRGKPAKIWDFADQ